MTYPIGDVVCDASGPEVVLPREINTAQQLVQQSGRVREGNADTHGLGTAETSDVEPNKGGGDHGSRELARRFGEVVEESNWGSGTYVRKVPGVEGPRVDDLGPIGHKA